MNEERKFQFAEVYTSSRVVDSKYIYSLIARADDFESRFGIDVSEFNKEQIEKFLTYFKSKSIGTLRTKSCVYKMYCDWCKGNGFYSGVNYWAEIKERDLKECVKSEFLRKYVDKSKFLLFANGFRNHCDKMLLIGMYEGFSLVELLGLRILDLNGNVINVIKPKIASDLLMSEILATQEEKFGYRYNHLKNDYIKYPFMESLYVIRFGLVRNSYPKSLEHKESTIRLRLKSMFQKAGFDISIPILKNSGLVNAIESKGSITESKLEELLYQYDFENRDVHKIRAMYKAYTGKVIPIVKK